ncbi:MAG: CDP-diacylglycerol--glycerol-3-phosphate 3-phosphatidyltransferase [Bdellovibrionaceae bacterium]|nr:CDP-diacylglycerol--glycerol-3-phosphate 3-phosphatidyltransferase [Pseudobdellovibrionaceae bacterium]
MDWQKRLPMQLTYARMALTAPILLCLWVGGTLCNALAAALFLLASITDYYDGYFARKYSAISNLGKFMDPIADKILVTSVLTWMISTDQVDPWMVILLTLRDTFVGGIRSVAAADGVVIAARSAGKWKTGVQMGAIPALMLYDEPVSWTHLSWGLLAYALLWLSVILSLGSGVQYYLAYTRSRGFT